MSEPENLAALAEPEELAVETRSLTRSFGAQLAVDGIDLRIRRGSFYGFLGENGAGKSTTISMLTGVLEPSSGSMRVLGHAPGPASKRRIGVVPDGLLLFDRLTGREHLVLIGRLFSLSRAEAARRADELLERMDLAQDGRKLIGDYSFGMRKKVALAAALIHGPELLFLDEPFEGVDAVAKASLTGLLADLVERRRLTVFLTSHVLEVVERLCDAVGIIHRGRLVAQGTLADVVRAVPGASNLTEAFVGLVGEGRGSPRALSFLP
jgi:ABC-2 type transport system ATP-binding protein